MARKRKAAEAPGVTLRVRTVPMDAETEKAVMAWLAERAEESRARAAADPAYAERVRLEYEKLLAERGLK